MNSHKSANWQNAVMLFLAVFIAAIYTWSVVKNVNLGLSDFVAHARVAEEIANGGKFPPHFLYQLILIGLHALAGLPFDFASFVAVFLFVLTTYFVARNAMAGKSDVSGYPISFAAFFLLISHPIVTLFHYDSHLYFGYIASNVYHNPTIILLKPIALLHFILLCHVLNGSGAQESLLRETVPLALLSALSIAAKPNYIIALLPALAALLLLRGVVLKSKEIWSIKVVAIGVILPSLAMLLLQYVYFYGGNSPNSIGFGLFDVFEVSSQLWTLLPKLVFSVAFPISLALLMGRRLIRNFEFQLAWTMFAVALFYTYFLIERVNGEQISAGNFWWSAQISHFILLFVSIRLYLAELNRNKSDVRQWSIYIPALVGALQLISGIAWFGSNVIEGYLVYW